MVLRYYYRVTKVYLKNAGQGNPNFWQLPNVPIEIPLGRAVYCLNDRQIFRPSWKSDKLKKLLLLGNMGITQLKFKIMKICNNCSTTNDMSALKCTACNMWGHFTPLGAREEMLVMESHNVQCGNCGNNSPGDGKHCMHCRFPMSQEKLKPIQVSKLQLYRKVG